MMACGEDFVMDLVCFSLSAVGGGGATGGQADTAGSKATTRATPPPLIPFQSARNRVSSARILQKVNALKPRGRGVKATVHNSSDSVEPASASVAKLGSSSSHSADGRRPSLEKEPAQDSSTISQPSESARSHSVSESKPSRNGTVRAKRRNGVVKSMKADTKKATSEPATVAAFVASQTGTPKRITQNRELQKERLQKRDEASDSASGNTRPTEPPPRKQKRKRRPRSVLHTAAIPISERNDPEKPEEERVKQVTGPRRGRSRGPSAKRTFSAYIDEISSTGLLAQREVIQLSSEIREGIAIEEKQNKLSNKLKRRASLPEIADSLNIPEEEVRDALLRGKAAKNRLVASNLRLVTSVCRRMSSVRKGKNQDNRNQIASAALSLDDMIQEGSMGLIRAAEKYDGSRGYKFSTYATWWIRAAVMRAITTQSRSIRVPCTVVDEYQRIKKEFERRRQGGEPTPDEKTVAQELGISVGKMRFVLNSVSRTTASLDLSIGSHDGSTRSTLAELIEGDDRVEERLVEEMQRNELDLALKLALQPRERAIIRLRFGLDDGHPRTLHEIGRILGMSKERVRQVTFKSLAKLNTPEMRRRLNEYLAT